MTPLAGNNISDAVLALQLVLRRQSRNDSASESKGKKRNKYNASEAGPRSEEKIKKY